MAIGDLDTIERRDRMELAELIRADRTQKVNTGAGYQIHNPPTAEFPFGRPDVIPDVINNPFRGLDDGIYEDTTSPYEFQEIMTRRMQNEFHRENTRSVDSLNYSTRNHNILRELLSYIRREHPNVDAYVKHICFNENKQPLTVIIESLSMRMDADSTERPNSAITKINRELASLERNKGK